MRPAPAACRWRTQSDNTAPRDGTVIGAPLNGMPTAPLLQPKATRFDPTKLIWIGSMYRSNNVAYVWHTAPVQSLDQLEDTGDDWSAPPDPAAVRMTLRSCRARCWG